MKIRNRHLIRFFARLVSWGCRVLYATCRKRVIEAVPGTSPYSLKNPDQLIYCVWHDAILNALFCGKSRKMAALTSRHADGEYVAEVMEAIGITPIRGSSSQGGSTAAKQLMSAASEHHITITPDGPRGPRRVIKPGIVFLASQTGRKIVPVACSASRAWKPQGRWTDLLIPKPFSTAYILGGEPFSVPAGLSKEQLVPYLQELQDRMERLQEKADAIANGRLLEVSPAVEKKAA